MTYSEFLRSDLGRWLDARLNTHQPDVVHDLLAFLAEQMIELNKKKEAEVRGFLTWLEGYIGVTVEELSNKTKIKTYHESDYNTLMKVLRQNRQKLKVDPDTRAVQEQIKKEYDQSIAKLKSLKARLDATDRLIDLIVYRLYGLTEEEVAIVEGTESA